MAGSVCKDWSSVGNQQGLLGPYVIPFACLLGIIIEVQPWLFLHENTRNFRSKLFDVVLESYENHHCSMCPPEFGCPSMRTRSYDAQALGSLQRNLDSGLVALNNIADL